MKRLSVIFCVVLLAGAVARPVCGQSPYRRSWSKDGSIAGVSLAAGTAAVLVSQSPEPLTARQIDALSRESINPFDRGATFNYSGDISVASDVLVGAVTAAPLALLFDSAVRDDWQTCALMYAETMALAVILPAYGKGTVERNRPYVYNPEVPMDRKTTSDAKKAFFSRHACAAFASASFLSTLYGDYHPGSAARRYVWAGTLIAAAAVGFMRCEAGEHYPTDVIAGAIVGSAIGYAIPRLHRASSNRLSLVPTGAGGHVGIALELRM